MTTIRKKDGWLTAEVGDELVMMSVANGKYIGLNEVGARIWQLLETPLSREALYAQLLEEFDVTAELCRVEVDAFLAELDRNSAIEVEG
ncbi:MAG TPA: PqqD family peptide modification chaperone [Rhizomicrobium sp.]